MRFNLTLTFTVKRLKNKQDAEDTAINLINHVLETFNDDESIDSKIAYYKVRRLKPIKTRSRG